MTYYEVGSRGELIDKTARFRLKGTVRLWGPAADSTLTPEFPGIHDADSMMDWDPPFPVDLRRIRQRDEDYWDRYRATPKGFVSLLTAKKLWTSRYGSLTSIRLGAAPGTSLAATAEKFREHLLERFGPEQTGLLFRPVKFQGLAGTKGSTDFGMLFVGFAIFLIISAALWVALLVRLGIERRAKEIGILMATGKPLRFLRRLFLVEGTLLAVLGGVVGLIGALGLWMVHGLWTAHLVAGSRRIAFYRIARYRDESAGWILGFLDRDLPLHRARGTLLGEKHSKNSAGRLVLAGTGKAQEPPA